VTNVFVFGLVIALDDLATAIWIGGLIQLSFVVLPVFRGRLRENREVKPLLMELQNRLSLLVLISIPILVVTGILESWHSPSFRGFFSFDNTHSTLLSIKHVLVILMVCIAASRKLLMARNVTKPKSKEMEMRREKMSAMMVFANALIGITVVVLSGFGAAVGAR
jgi:uncharacterized membrane protein